MHINFTNNCELNYGDILLKISLPFQKSIYHLEHEVREREKT